jgi:hypothetical protein
MPETPPANNQAEMRNRLLMAQQIAYQNQVAMINAAQMQEEEAMAEQAEAQGATKKPPSWETQYMALLFTGIFVDALSCLEYLPAGGLITVPMNFMFSVYRWRTLERLNAGFESSTQMWMRRFRTVMGGGISMIAGGSCANTQTMFWEYMVKKNIKPSSILTTKATGVGRVVR